MARDKESALIPHLVTAKLGLINHLKGRQYVILALAYGTILVLAGNLLPPLAEAGSLESTRAQLLWSSAWVISLAGASCHAANFSYCQRLWHMRNFWKSVRAADSLYLLSVLTPAMAFAVTSFGLAAVASLIFGCHEQWSSWLEINLQAFILALFGVFGVSALAAGLASRISQSVAVLIALAVAGWGLWGVTFLEWARGGHDQNAATVADVLWTISPHLHFADLTQRVTFGWGPMRIEPFLVSIGYLLCLDAVFFVIARILFSYRHEG